ncbi:MAG: DUF1906 domain-containing protein [Peptococcaceae bacterium]|nr:DUF1906 domain-containing protein [Peptococcaceae bacterium]
MEGIDCSTRLTGNKASALQNSGISAVGRYLGYKKQKWSKTIAPEEAQAILNIGVGIFLIWESNPTYSGYFKYDKGVSDARSAIEEAQYLGVPQGIAIYFTVDYDAQTEDMPAIIDYFRGLADGMAGQYLIGAYGSYRVLSALKGSSYPPDKYYQTYAWSYGQKFPAHIYQYQNGITLKGIEIDRDTVQPDAGLWLKEDDIVEHAVIYFTDRDYSSARIVSRKLGNCAMYCRDGVNTNIHPDVKNGIVKHPVIIGGAEYHDNPNTTNCCGENAEDTAALAAKYANTL